MATASRFMGTTTPTPDRHAQFHARFTPNQQNAMQSEDNYTWKTIALELVSVVAFGLLGMAVSVVYVTLTH